MSAKCSDRSVGPVAVEKRSFMVQFRDWEKWNDFILNRFGLKRFGRVKKCLNKINEMINFF